MRGTTRALLRLFGVQAGWSFERMNGIGVGFAAEPLIEAEVPAGQRAAARARSAEFFNTHPWLAGLAVGAEVRAEADGVAGPQVERLRTALSSPLGALGDQVFWAGLIPALVALGVMGALRFGWPAVAGAVAAAVACRVAVTVWALRQGLASGLLVGRVVQGSWLPRAGRPLGFVAALLVGLAIPRIAAAALPATHAGAAPLVAGVALAGAALGLRLGARANAVRLGLGTLTLLLLWQAVS
ncbi:MAG TPA: PTS system mannose/fructose/sorbose family transporter subunit IID [Gemmatimonadales bacterium]|nr:PTS system mannose/fructose/sorbose family transporter subunit IID [Gemmatimonadales bacterium]